MNNQTLVIYDFKILYEILSELENHINFSLLYTKKLADLNFKTLNNYLIISGKKQNIENQIIIDQLPIHINRLIELININFLKKKYIQQSEIDLGTYKLNLNSRKIFNEKNSLNLTEREANIVIFLYNSKKPVKISKLQTEVWGHNSKLETHNIFNDENFIKSSKAGYIIQ